MRKALVRTGLLAVVAGLCLASGGSSAPPGRPLPTKDWLFVSQDEASLEKAIARYLKEKDSITAQYKFYEKDQDDLYLTYLLNPKEAPDVTLLIDTQPTAHGKDKAVTERAVKLLATYELDASAKTRDARAKILELINTWHQDMWVPGHVYLDEDGDLCLETYLNIPSADVPVHAETIRDQAMRMVDAWEDLYKRLKAVVKVGPATRPAAVPTPSDDDE